MHFVCFTNTSAKKTTFRRWWWGIYANHHTTFYLWQNKWNTNSTFSSSNSTTHHHHTTPHHNLNVCLTTGSRENTYFVFSRDPRRFSALTHTLSCARTKTKKAREWAIFQGRSASKAEGWQLEKARTREGIHGCHFHIYLIIQTILRFLMDDSSWNDPCILNLLITSLLKMPPLLIYMHFIVTLTIVTLKY